MPTSLLDDPMVQAGVAPFVVALLVAAMLMRWRRLAWLAVPAALVTTWLLTTGIGFAPLSSSRKAMLVMLAAPLLGLGIDMAGWRHRALAPLLALGAGALSSWVFASVLVQAEGAQGWLLASGVGLFVALMTGLMLRLRDDGVASGAATLALGVAAGVCALLSASIGTLMNGLALAMGGAALLALQFIRNRAMPAGFTGSLTAGGAAALLAAGTLVLAELRWPALVLLLAVPLVVSLPLLPQRAPRLRSVVLAGAAGAAALAPIAMAWWATAGAAT